MRGIDELHLLRTFLGTHMLSDQSALEGTHAGQRHIGTLMRRMGIEALAPQPGTGKEAPHNNISIHATQNAGRARQLGLGVGHPYIPMAKGFVYLAAVVDVASRLVLTQGRSCVGGVPRPQDHRRGLCTIRRAEDLQHRSGPPVHGRGICRCSVEQRFQCRWMAGAWRDTVFFERLRRSVKYERVYLMASTVGRCTCQHCAILRLVQHRASASKPGAGDAQTNI